MTDTNFPLSSANDTDDLPRTLRRERDRQRAAAAGGGPSTLSSVSHDHGSSDRSDDLTPAAVKKIEVPFWRLMLFFIKAVLAAIPALVLLGALIWGGMEALQTFYPDLIQTKVIICSPSNPKC
ncbi:MAG: hypothetical protein ACT4N2_12870 [Hyphomicrobium sp.]